VLVNFWAPWCVPCREEFPELQTLQSKFAAGGLVVLGVTAEDDPKKIAHFLDKIPVSFQILQDLESGMHRAANVETMPSTLLVDASGKVIKVYSGYSRERGLREMERDVAEQLGRKS
jgi:thiol-disulfide isomerase/thioredoxin